MLSVFLNIFLLLRYEILYVSDFLFSVQLVKNELGILSLDLLLEKDFVVIRLLGPDRSEFWGEGFSDCVAKFATRRFVSFLLISASFITKLSFFCFSSIEFGSDRFELELDAERRHCGWGKWSRYGIQST